MITAETIYQKAKQLDHSLLQEAADFIDFLAYKRKADFERMLHEKRQYFTETEIELPTDKPAYVTKQLTLEEMDAAVEYEAGQHK